MKAWWIPIAVLLGLGLGWLLAGMYYGDPGGRAGGPPVGEVEIGPGSDPVGDPVLRGHASAEGASGPATVVTGTSPAPSVDAPDVVEFVGPDGFETLIEWEGEVDSQTLGQRGWHALLTLYALAGRGTDFDRAVPKALEAGVEAAHVLELLQLLPVDLHVALVDGLRQDFPDQPWAVAILAGIYTNAGAGERAFEVLVPALEEEADLALAAQLVEASPDRAARVLGALASEAGWSGEMLGEIGQAFVTASRLDLALPFLQDALGKQPVNHAVLMSLAQVDPTLALEHARTLTTTEGTGDEVWTWLGELELSAGNAAAAFEAYREAASRKLTTDVLYGLMRADPERAFDAVAELTEHTSDDEILGAVAKVALKSGRDEDTMSTLLRAHARDPTDHEWMVAMVTLDPARAVEVLAATARQFQGDSRDEILGAYANALLGLGKTADAFARFREAYEIDPSDWEWQRGLARTDPERAIPLLEARRKEAGDEGDLIGALADAYLGTGRRAEAQALYEKAITAGGGDEWYARLALVDPEGATRRLEARTQEQPDSAEVWAALGDLHETLGDKAAARAAYDQARNLNQTNLLYEIRYRNLAD